MSFAFTIEDEDYDIETHTYTIRSIDKLFDVAAVDFPAYDNTSISARKVLLLSWRGLEKLIWRSRQTKSVKKELLLKLRLGGVLMNKRLKEILERKQELRKLIEQDDNADLNAISTELDEIEAEERQIKDKQNIIERMSKGETIGNVISQNFDKKK